jgi:hypothetical protein
MAPMLLRLDDETRMEEFCDHFGRSGFAVERVGGSMIAVARPGAPDAEERGEIQAHLWVWLATNTEVPVSIVPSRQL